MARNQASSRRSPFAENFSASEWILLALLLPWACEFVLSGGIRPVLTVLQAVALPEVRPTFDLRAFHLSRLTSSSSGPFWPSSSTLQPIAGPMPLLPVNCRQPLLLGGHFSSVWAFGQFDTARYEWWGRYLL